MKEIIKEVKGYELSKQTNIVRNSIDEVVARDETWFVYKDGEYVEQFWNEQLALKGFDRIIKGKPIYIDYLNEEGVELLHKANSYSMSVASKTKGKYLPLITIQLEGSAEHDYDFLMCIVLKNNYGKYEMVKTIEGYKDIDSLIILVDKYIEEDTEIEE